jgi:hypothetical protein
MTALRVRAIVPDEVRGAEAAIVRIGIFVAATLLVFGAASGARAQQTDFAGKWSFSGQIVRTDVL